MNLTSVSFVLPMYNEEKGITDTIGKIKGVAAELSNDYEIIIADDGSTDACGRIVDNIAKADSHLRVVHLEKNTKFGGALSAGLKRASKDIIIYTDSDLPIDVSDIKKALQLLDKSDIVTAYSKVEKNASLKRQIMSAGYNFLVQSLFRTNIRDINSGFKIYKRKVFEGMELISKSPFIDVEIFARAMRKKFIITQYPIIFRHREAGKSYISHPAVIFQTMIDMLRFRLNIN